MEARKSNSNSLYISCPTFVSQHCKRQTRTVLVTAGGCAESFKPLIPNQFYTLTTPTFPELQAYLVIAIVSAGFAFGILQVPRAEYLLIEGEEEHTQAGQLEEDAPI